MFGRFAYTVTTIWSQGLLKAFEYRNWNLVNKIFIWMLEECNQIISANPEAILTGYDQTPGRPSLAYGRQTGVRDLLVLLLGPACVVDGAAPSMLTHRKTAVMATLSRGVRLGWWLQLPKQHCKGKPFFVCACAYVFELVVCFCVRAHVCVCLWRPYCSCVCIFLRVCLSVLTAKKLQQHLTWQLLLLSVQLFPSGSLFCDTIFSYNHMFINGDCLLFHTGPVLLKVYQVSAKL